LQLCVKLDLKRQLLDSLLHLVATGYVLPVIRQVRLWSAVEDQSLTRYFIVKVWQQD
jgi:hypothetical protein